MGAGLNTNGGDAWALRTQSPSVASGSSTEGWLQNNGMNGNANGSIAAATNADPWLAKPTAAPLVPSNNASSSQDAWLTDNNRTRPAQTAAAALADPWAPKTEITNNDYGWQTSVTAKVLILN